MRNFKILSTMDYMSFLRPFLPRFGKIAGISEEEITGLEAKYNVVLPEAYKQYMRILGKENGKFMQATEMRIDYLEEIPEAYQEDLANTVYDNPVPIGENWYFFGMDMGNCLYFECDGNPDPKVWIIWAINYVDDIYPSFTAFLKQDVDLTWNR